MSWVSGYLLVTSSMTLKACTPGDAVTVRCPAQGYGYYCIVAYGAGVTVTVEDIAIVGTSPVQPYSEWSGFAAIDATLELRNVSATDFGSAVYLFPDQHPPLAAISGGVFANGNRAEGTKAIYAGRGAATLAGAVTLANWETGLYVSDGSLECLAGSAVTQTNDVNLCGGGGVAVNCTCNG